MVRMTDGSVGNVQKGYGVADEGATKPKDTKKLSLLQKINRHATTAIGELERYCAHSLPQPPRHFVVAGRESHRDGMRYEVGSPAAQGKEGGPGQRGDGHRHLDVVPHRKGPHHQAVARGSGGRGADEGE